MYSCYIVKAWIKINLNEKSYESEEEIDKEMNNQTLLLVPPCFTDRTIDFEIGFPVHLLYLGNALEKVGWETHFYDMTLEEKEGVDSFSKLDSILKDFNIGLVGISNHTVRTFVTSKLVASHIKSLRPDVKIVVGGVGSTFMWKELMESCPAIDFVIRGYGQRSLAELVATLENGNVPDVPGLVFRKNKKLESVQMHPIKPDDFIAPSVKLTNSLMPERYLNWTKTYSLFTHAGCSFSCKFCTSVMPAPFQNREVYRKMDDILDEISTMVDIGFEKFFMSSNNFTSKRKWVLEFCKNLVKAGIPKKATWVCMSRIESLDKEMLEAMEEAGCTNIAFGIEGVGAEQWNMINKGKFSKAKTKSVFKLTKKVKIGTSAYLILGIPYQTAKDIQSTIEFLRELNPDYRVISFFQPFPGTPYWDEPEKYGISEIAPLEDWNFYEAPICRTKQCDKTTLLRAMYKMYLDVGNGKGIEPQKDKLINVDDIIPRDPEIPESAQYMFENIIGGKTVVDALEATFAKYGARGRLIALYWLSAALKNNSFKIDYSKKPGLKYPVQRKIFEKENLNE